MTGKRIKHYEIRDLIGRGAMGAVYCAYDTQLDREVAIKFLSETGQANPAGIERFYREARAAARLSHPNVVTIHDVGEHEGACYFVMELLPGASLRQVIDRGEATDWRDKLQLVIQVCRALEAAHAEGLLHRDIKADNIWILPEGGVKVLDFGIARTTAAQTLTHAGETLGTPEYMAPEQIMGDTLDGRADLYALGVQMYELFAGRLPFVGPNPVTVIYKQMEEDPVPPSRVAKDMPVAVEPIILKALEKDPDRRFGSAREMRAAIEALLGEQPADADSNAVSPDAVRPDAVSEDAPMVGRDEELAQLCAAVDALSENCGGTVFIGGDAGVGKTRLAHEVLAHVRKRGALTLSGSCLYSEGTEPYLPFLEALGQRLGAESAKERQKVLAFIREEAPELEGLTSRLMTAIQTRRTVSGMADENVASSRERLFEAITQVLLFLSRRAPVVLLLDDVHWADSASLQLLYYVARSAQTQRLLVLCTYRPEDMSVEDGAPHPLADTMQRLNREGFCRKLDLAPLAPKCVEQMLRGLFHRRAFSRGFRESLYQETGGNPLFVLEVIKLLRDEGVLFQHNGVWRERREITRADIPDRVYDVVAQRLSRLSEDERDLLQMASVSGRTFTSHTLAHIGELTRMRVLKALNRLERRYRVIRSDGQGYVFDHEKVREILYEELSLELRQAYHLAYGAYLETEGGASAAELGQHFYHGEAFDRALPYLIATGDRALRMFAYREARDAFGWALDSLTHAKTPGAASAQALHLRLGDAHNRLGDSEAALNALECAVVAALKAGDADTEAMAHRQVGQVLLSQGDFEGSAARFRVSADKFRDVGNQAGVCDVLIQAANIPFERGDWKRVQAYFDRALRLAEQADLQKQRGIIHMNSGIMATIRGQTDRARDLFDKSGAIFENLRDWKNLTKLWINRGWLLERLEDWDAVEAAYRRALDLAKKTRNIFQEAECHLNLAQVLLETANLAGCKRACLTALEIFRKINRPLGAADAYKTLGLVAAAERNWDDARVYFEKSIDENEALSHALGAGSGHLAYARMLKEADDVRAASDHVAAAHRWFEKIDAQDEIEEVGVLMRDIEAMAYLAESPLPVGEIA